MSKICDNCGKKITDSTQIKYCNIECRIEFHDKNGSPSYIKNNINRKNEDKKRYYDCICPGCGELHRHKMYWTGRAIIPKIRCNSCKGLAVYREYEELEEYYIP